jgi:hypothetical protein
MVGAWMQRWKLIVGARAVKGYGIVTTQVTSMQEVIVCEAQQTKGFLPASIESKVRLRMQQECPTMPARECPSLLEECWGYQLEFPLC